MKIKQSTLLLVASITLTFVVLFGYIYANTIVIEACTDMVRAKSDIATQESEALRGVIKTLTESVPKNCYCLKCHGGER